MTNLRLFCGLALASVAALGAQTIQAQNFLVNSNFATGDFSGWNVAETGSGGSPQDFGVTATTDGGQTVPNPGNTYGAFFNPAGGTMDLSQSIDLPAAGSYILTCAIEPVFNDVDVVNISLAGQSVFSTNFEVGQPYTEISVAVSAQAGSQLVDFQFTPGSGPIFFDDAGLAAVNSAPPPPPPPPPPANTPCSALGSADAGAVIGLDGAAILNFGARIEGDEYVSKGGVLDNLRPSVVTGNVFEYHTNEYFGRGSLKGSVSVDSALLDSVNSDASNAAVTIAGLTPTQTFGSIRRATVITGNGGLNVIDIHGDITRSLVLNGTSNDVFFVNVSGSIDLVDRATLGVSNGVAAGSVLYNLTGRGFVSIRDRSSVNGTILAPGYNIELEGDFNGAIIGGGRHRAIQLFDATIHQPVCGQ